MNTIQMHKGKGREEREGGSEHIYVLISVYNNRRLEIQGSVSTSGLSPFLVVPAMVTAREIKQLLCRFACHEISVCPNT